MTAPLGLWRWRLSSSRCLCLGCDVQAVPTRIPCALCVAAWVFAFERFHLLCECLNLFQKQGMSKHSPAMSNHRLCSGRLHSSSADKGVYKSTSTLPTSVLTRLENGCVMTRMHCHVKDDSGCQRHLELSNSSQPFFLNHSQ